MSVYWIIVFLKKINCFRKYQRGIAKQITNVESDYINVQYYYHYETHIRVLVYLILMNLVDISIGFAYFFELVLKYYYKSTGKYKLYWNRLVQCGNVNNTLLLEFQIFDSSIPYITTFMDRLAETLGYVTSVTILIALTGVCIMISP